MDNRLIARIARQGGRKLLNLAVERLLPEKEEAQGARPARRSLTGKIAGAALTRVATRSVPGAIAIGGGILAKSLYDRRRAKKARTGAKTGKGPNGQP